jgi:hypothetical protein
MKLLSVAIAVASISMLAQTANAASTIAPGFDSSSLVACDDCFSGATSLGFSANFFGTTYTDTYVSNNGYITFGAGQGTYTPTGLTSSYTGLPIIAAFYADVDTRGVGTTPTTYGTGSYAGHAAFGVNYLNNGYYSAETDKLNSFQLILVNRSDIAAGDFDIYFNYAQIQYETGDVSGGHDGLGGTSAAVGYATGGPTGSANSFQLPGSLTPGSFIDSGTSPLVTTSNDGVPGQFLFEVRDGQVIVTPGVPESSTWAMIVLGFCGIGFVARRRRGSSRALASI